jgi:hypothetical protein
MWYRIFNIACAYGMILAGIQELHRPFIAAWLIVSGVGFVVSNYKLRD